MNTYKSTQKDDWLSTSANEVFKSEVFTDESPIDDDNRLDYADFQKRSEIVTKTMAFKLGLQHGPGFVEVEMWRCEATRANMIRVKLTVFTFR